MQTKITSEKFFLDNAFIVEFYYIENGSSCMPEKCFKTAQGRGLIMVDIQFTGAMAINRWITTFDINMPVALEAIRQAYNEKTSKINYPIKKYLARKKNKSSWRFIEKILIGQSQRCAASNLIQNFK